MVLLMRVETMKNKNRTPLELYIHIPFCVQKCQYCDFLSGPSDQETRDRYIKALRAEIHMRKAFVTSRFAEKLLPLPGVPSIKPLGFFTAMASLPQ